MMKTIKNIEDSVRAKLHNRRKEMGIPFVEILQNYMMERFLYRFSQTEFSNKFILKGALLFAVWKIQERRTTLDIDLLANYSNKVNEIEKAVKKICKATVQSDGLHFDPDSVSGIRIKEGADYEGVRIKFLGFLGKSKIFMQIDFGFGDVMYPKPRVIDYPVILDFPKPHLKGYPVESVVSEKFEAMVQLGELNSRMKDFYDIWLLAHQFAFDGAKFSESLKRTFGHRKTLLPKKKPLFAKEIYDENSDRQILWKTFLRKGEIKHAPETLSSTAKAIEKFLLKPLVAISKEEKFAAKWNISGRWE